MHRSAVAAPAIVALGIILAVYGWLIAPQLAKPFVYDDVNFALGARAIAQTGLPYGNQGYLLHLYEQRDQWSLWHPPLYLYALGLTMALFGTSETAARSLGVVCQLVSAGLTFDLARRLAPEESEPTRAVAGVLAVALFLLGPLNVQSALILDIDNTVLMTLIALNVWLVLRLPTWWTPRIIGLLAVLYAVTLWAKLTTPLLLLAALAFTRLFQGTGPRGALQALAVGALGWLLFLVSWLVVTGLTGMPRDYTFIVVYREAMDSQASSRDRFVSWQAFTGGVAPAILWIGPFFCLLFLATGLPRLWQLVRGRGLRASDLAIVLGAVIYLLYIVKLAGGFPKYHAAMLPLWSAACGAAVARAAGRPGWGQLAVVLAGSLATAGWLAARLGDEWDIQLWPSLVRLLLVVPLVVGAAVTGLWAQIGRTSIWRGLPVALTALTLAWAVPLNVHQRGLTGSTGYYYGRWGQVDAARLLDDRLGPDELYIASKEVAWYSHNQQYVDQESWQHATWEAYGGTFDGTWLGQEIRLLVLEVADESARRSYEALLLPRYRVFAESGNFILLERDGP